MPRSFPSLILRPLAILLSASLFALPAHSASPTETDEPFFSYRVVHKPNQYRGLYWRPLFSFLLPGLDQWMEGQYRSAAVYSGYAGFGLFAAANFGSVDQAGTDPGDSLSSQSKWEGWGSQAYQDAGFISAFHTFRKAAETKKAEGRFEFLSHEETTGDLLLATMNFGFLARPAVFIPLGAALAIAVLGANEGPKSANWRGDDIGFSTAVSFNAGVSEEAFFRGYMMPMMKDAWDSNLWSNVASSTVFAAAHISSDNPIPWPQFLAGLYFGWRVQKNEWQLSESVFIHTWWDILLLSGSLAYNRGQAISMPLLHAEF